MPRFLFTSTTGIYGRALIPASGAPAAWITEDVAPVPRNVYGATKTAAEDLCKLVSRTTGWRVWYCAPRASSPRPTIGTMSGRPTPTNIKTNVLRHHPLRAR